MKFTNFRTFVLRQIEKNYAQYYNSYEEFVDHCESGEVTVPLPYMITMYEDFKAQLPLSYSEDRPAPEDEDQDASFPAEAPQEEVIEITSKDPQPSQPEDSVSEEHCGCPDCTYQREMDAYLKLLFGNKQETL